jgi:hypothetical protein
MTTTDTTVDASVDDLTDIPASHRAGASTRTTKGGAPYANRNALTHGLRAGRLPQGCAFITRQVNDFAREVRRAVVDAKGGVSITDAASINSATRWERHSCLSLRWLRLHCDSMSHDQRLAYSREIAKASSERDKCVRALGLDIRDIEQATPGFMYDKDTWQHVEPDAPPATPPASADPATTEITPDAQDASQGDVVDVVDVVDVAATVDVACDDSLF